jgi:hypothetical protein
LIRLENCVGMSFTPEKALGPKPSRPAESLAERRILEKFDHG